MWHGWCEEALEIIQIWFPYLEELTLVVGAEVDFRHQEVQLAKPFRKPWHYNLQGFGPESVSPEITWTEIENEAAGKIANLVEDRAEHALEIFAELGIDRTYGKAACNKQ